MPQGCIEIEPFTAINKRTMCASVIMRGSDRRTERIRRHTQIQRSLNNCSPRRFRFGISKLSVVRMRRKGSGIMASQAMSVEAPAKAVTSDRSVEAVPPETPGESEIAALAYECWQ